MPPKPKITKNMVIDAAFEVAREAGGENINARTVAKKLNCSTQPVMYHFATIEELKQAVYAKSNWYHTEYLMNIQKPQQGVMLGIDSEELVPIISAMQGAMGLSMAQTKKVFLTIALFAHGYASIIANNSLEYDEALIKSHLEQAYRGALLAVQEETK